MFGIITIKGLKWAAMKFANYLLTFSLVCTSVCASYDFITEDSDFMVFVFHFYTLATHWRGVSSLKMNCVPTIESSNEMKNHWKSHGDTQYKE